MDADATNQMMSRISQLEATIGHLQTEVGELQAQSANLVAQLSELSTTTGSAQEKYDRAIARHEQFFGNIAVAGNHSCCTDNRCDEADRRSMLDALEPGSDREFYMLALFCFDLARKMKYLHEAAVEAIDSADPCFARGVLDDHERLSGIMNNIDDSAEDLYAQARTAEAIVQRRACMGPSREYMGKLQGLAGKCSGPATPTS